MTKEIPLTQGKVALVDDEDFARVGLHKWYYHSTGYARRTVHIGHGRKHRTTGVEFLHRSVIQAPDGWQVDHINHNKLDCRRANLRLCTHGQNITNRSSQARSTSQYKGVHFTKNRWQATIQVNGKSIYLGRFTDEVDAALAYDAAARICHGEFAWLNFSDAEREILSTDLTALHAAVDELLMVGVLAALVSSSCFLHSRQLLVSDPAAPDWATATALAAFAGGVAA